MRPDTAVFTDRLQEAGMEGGLIISPPPVSYAQNQSGPDPWKERLQVLLELCKNGSSLLPFFWIDPLAPGAVGQVAAARKEGAAGLKIICWKFFPGDSRVLSVCRAAAEYKLPVLFHSGILWNGAPSARFNRPGNFEELLEVPGLRFALAHASWPWCDECLAVYGKFLNAKAKPGGNVPQMFIDITPGTPPIYRSELLTKIYTIGYDIRRNLIFGSDSAVDEYNSEWVRQWVKRDRGIYSQLDLSPPDQDAVFGDNLLRFAGADSGQSGAYSPKTVKPGENP